MCPPLGCVVHGECPEEWIIVPNPSGTLSKKTTTTKKPKSSSEFVRCISCTYSQTPVQLWLCSHVRLQTLPSLCSRANLPSMREPHALIFHSMVRSFLVNAKCFWNTFHFGSVLTYMAGHFDGVYRESNGRVFAILLIPW